MVRHLFQHSGERPYKCQSCDTSFTQLNRLKEHIKKHHEEFPPSIPKDIMKKCDSRPHSGSTISSENYINSMNPCTKTPGVPIIRPKQKAGNTGISHFKPIAPAPPNKSEKPALGDLRNSSIIPSSNGTIILPSNLPTPTVQQTSNSYLTQGTNGAMYLVTNPIPTINTQSSQILLSHSNGILQLLQQPTNPFNTTFVVQNSQPNIPGYVQTPILSSFPTYQQQIPFLSMNPLASQTSSMVFPNFGQTTVQQISKSLISTDVKQETRPDTSERNEVSQSMCDELKTKAIDISNTMNSVSSTPDVSKLVSSSKSSFKRNISSVDGSSKETIDSSVCQQKNDLLNETLKNKRIFSVGSLNENTVSYQNETGETVKLDILERAILTIPELSKL